MSPHPLSNGRSLSLVGRVVLAVLTGSLVTMSAAIPAAASDDVPTATSGSAPSTSVTAPTTPSSPVPTTSEPSSSAAASTSTTSPSRPPYASGTAAAASLPLGNWEVLTAAVSTVSVAGWAMDPDQPAAAVPVHVYVDGSGTALTADTSRPDVGAAFSGAGPSHGFSWSTTVPRGQHTICVYAIDVQAAWTNTPLGCRSIGTQVTLPLGNWEQTTPNAAGLDLSGWGFDPDQPTATTAVHVYANGRFVGLGSSTTRTDVGAAFPGAGSAHGWTARATLFPGTYTVCVYVIDVDDPNRNTPLGCRVVASQLALPMANWEALTVSGTTVRASGWAFDPDRPGEYTQVHIYVDGAGTALWTGAYRPDVTAAFPAAHDSTGWDVLIGVTPGVHRVCVYAIDADFSSKNLPLGCREVRVMMTTPSGNWEAFTVQGARLLLSGWAFDADHPGEIFRPEVTVDGESWGSPVTGQPRADVAAAFPAAGPSAGWTFDHTVTPGSHRVCVTLPDTDVPGVRLDLGCRSAVTTRTLPIGHVDVLTASNGLLTMSGWALDPEDPTTSIEVTTMDQYDGVELVRTADGDRPDVATAFPGAGAAHGWTIQMPQAQAGGETVCVTARSAFGINSLGCTFVLNTR